MISAFWYDEQIINQRFLRFVKADFENLSFEDNVFDIAYPRQVVEHLDDPVKACMEMQ